MSVKTFQYNTVTHLICSVSKSFTQHNSIAIYNVHYASVCLSWNRQPHNMAHLWWWFLLWCWRQPELHIILTTKWNISVLKVWTKGIEVGYGKSWTLRTQFNVVRYNVHVHCTVYVFFSRCSHQWTSDSWIPIILTPMAGKEVLTYDYWTKRLFRIWACV